MRRLIIALALLAMPMQAQIDSATNARLTTLEANYAKLRAELGPYGDSVPPSGDFASHCPALPNERYSVWCRVQQIGLGIDDNNRAVSGVQSQVNGFGVRLAAVEGGNGPIVVPTLDGGNLIVPGKLIIGGCDSVSYYSQKVQICGSNAEIRLVANVDGLNNQGSARHQHLFGAQADGGLRLEFNWVCKIGEVVTVDNGACWTEPSKARRILAFDSQGTLSFSDDKYPVIDNSQTMVLQLDRASKTASWTLMKAGWRWLSCISTGTNTFDRCYPVPQQ